MRKAMMHLAQFLCHSPTYHSLAMWRHPRTTAAGFDWARPELYQHIARVCERGRFDMVFFADLNYISDTFTGSLAPALRNATQAPEHDPIPLLSFMAAGGLFVGLTSRILGDDDRTVSIARELQFRCWDIRAIRPPSVPPDSARLRISVHADHDRETLAQVAAAVAELAS